MYRIVYLECDNHDSVYMAKKSVWCYGRECSIMICQTLYQSPYVGNVALYDADDNIVEFWGLE